MVSVSVKYDVYDVTGLWFCSSVFVCECEGNRIILAAISLSYNFFYKLYQGLHVHRSFHVVHKLRMPALCWNLVVLMIQLFRSEEF